MTKYNVTYTNETAGNAGQMQVTAETPVAAAETAAEMHSGDDITVVEVAPVAETTAEKSS